MHIGGLVELAPVARSTRRKLPGDAVGRVSQLAVPIDLHDGRVAFEAGPGAYAALPAWHNRGAWLGAVKVHPRLLEACARLVKPSLFLEIMRELSSYADPATGRDIAVVHADIAVAIGVCTKTVQRACTIGYRLARCTWWPRAGRWPSTSVPRCWPTTTVASRVAGGASCRTSTPR